jgi:hypothetical protein
VATAAKTNPAISVRGKARRLAGCGDFSMKSIYQILKGARIAQCEGPKDYAD